MATVLTIIGILLTIFLSAPAINLCIRKYSNFRERRRWSADLLVEKALVPKLDHYAFDSWDQKINVDHVGSAVHVVNARMMNISPDLISHLYFTVYCDGTDIPGEAVRPWAKLGRKNLHTKLEDWDYKKARGRINILIAPPVQPGKRIRIRWGYTLPNTFGPGNEYYNWDIATLHYEISGRIIFSQPWKILYARWDDDLIHSQDVPKIDGSIITWKVHFPDKGQRIMMKIGLDKTA